MADTDLKTPLYQVHKAHGAKMVPFGGWLMPVSYSSVLQEHQTVRTACGLFDVSHMGELQVKGPAATAFLQRVSVNDVTRLGDGEGQYTAILHPDGGMIDDLIIYRIQADHYFVCVNASNTDKDYQWLLQQASAMAGVKVTNESTQWCQLAVQGPKSTLAVEALLSPVTKAQLSSLNYMQIMPVKLFGIDGLIARTGYTGEHGYELYVPNAIAERTWHGLMETQSQTGIQPIGLGARDTLRLEACYLLYGNDMNDGVSPLEAGISWAVRLEKGDFVGREALVAQKAAGLNRSQFALRMNEDGIPRHGMEVFKDGELVGVINSGSVLPTLGGAGGLALLNPKKVAVGDVVEVDVRGKRKLARLVPKPLYKAKVKS